MPIEAYYSKPRLAVLAVVTGFLPLLGLAVIVTEISSRMTGKETGPIDTEFLTYVPILFLFTPFFIRYLRHIFDRDPVLSIDETGVFDRRWVDRAIPWSAIASSAVARIGFQSSIWLVLSAPLSDYTTGGPKRMLAKLGAFSRMLAVSCTELSIGVETIQASIDHYLQRGRHQHASGGSDADRAVTRSLQSSP
jgi:hypothetical protein